MSFRYNDEANDVRRSFGSNVNSQTRTRAEYEHHGGGGRANVCYNETPASNHSFYTTRESEAVREGSTLSYNFVRHDEKEGVVNTGVFQPQDLMPAPKILITSITVAATATGDVFIRVPGASEAVRLQDWYKLLVVRPDASRFFFVNQKSGVKSQCTVAHVYFALLKKCENAKVSTEKACELLREGFLNGVDVPSGGANFDALQFIELFRIVNLYNTKDKFSAFAVFLRDLLPCIANNNLVSKFLVRSLVTRAAAAASEESGLEVGVPLVSVCDIDARLYMPFVGNENDTSVQAFNADVDVVCFGLVQLLSCLYEFLKNGARVAAAEKSAEAWQSVQNVLREVKDVGTEASVDFYMTKASQMWSFASNVIIQCINVGTLHVFVTFCVLIST